MKKIALLIMALSVCGVAIADTITINWGVDNQPYTTTTCEIGGDVVLPSVSKRGYIFRGWTPEHFDRGTFADWNSVPKNTTSYLVDYYNNRTPMYNDFMVVTNASGVPPKISGFISISKQDGHAIIINNVPVGYPNATRTYTLNGITYTVTNSGGGNHIVLTANKGVIYNNVVIKAGSEIIHTRYGGETINSANLYYSTLDDLEGTWRFKYEGTWETDGQAGWKPDYQITNNQNE